MPKLNLSHVPCKYTIILLNMRNLIYFIEQMNSKSSKNNI